MEKDIQALEDFERKGQELVCMMVALCEKRYAAAKHPQCRHADAMAKSSLTVIEAMKTFAAVANLPDNQ